MGTSEVLISLPVEIQTYLGAGYLGYAMGYLGLRSQHRRADTILLVFVFGAIASVVFNFVKEYFSLPPTIVVTLIASAFFGVMWRSYARRWMYSALNMVKLNQDDGNATAWETLQDELTHKGVTQLSVHLSNGGTLYCNDAGKYINAASNGMNIAHDGSILMVVEEEDLPDGTLEKRTGVTTKNGTRLTYIPKEEIRRVNIRIE